MDRKPTSEKTSKKRRAGTIDLMAVGRRGHQSTLNIFNLHIETREIVIDLIALLLRYLASWHAESEGGRRRDKPALSLTSGISSAE